MWVQKTIRGSPQLKSRLRVPSPTSKLSASGASSRVRSHSANSLSFPEVESIANISLKRLSISYCIRMSLIMPVAASLTPSPAPFMTRGEEYSLRMMVTFSVPLIQ